jgi:hypothetical protein
MPITGTFSVAKTAAEWRDMAISLGTWTHSSRELSLNA